MSANERQIGGKHYKTAYEHWDLTMVIPMTYMEGCATKYVIRARKKHGKEDLDKALHYVDKMIECYDAVGQPERHLEVPAIEEEVALFAVANKLNAMEEEFVTALCTYSRPEDLLNARSIIIALGADGPGTPEDGGHHEQRT
jgi:Protein of unknwon function (DUF3310)